MWLLLLACQAAAPPAGSSPLPFKLTFAAKIPAPTAIASSAGDPDAIYVTEQSGHVWRVEAGRQTLALDIEERVEDGGEKGLLGLAFAPTWPADPRIFVNYTWADGGLHTAIASFVLDPATHRADPASEVRLLTYDQPFSNHNSGPVLFGPDGYLYVTVGDGGSGGDPKGNGQNLAVLLGKILRLDVSGPSVRIPPDNPFVGRPDARPEIWAYGVRNPWGAHFDGATLWFADVGQNRWEEVDVGVAGANYGWNRLEGTHCYPADPCDRTGVTLPVAEYDHDAGNSVTGGLVYRGPSIPALDGKYVYADFGSGRLWTVTQGAAAVEVTKLDKNVSTFGADQVGRLYLGDYAGFVWRVDPP